MLALLPEAPTLGWFDEAPMTPVPSQLVVPLHSTSDTAHIMREQCLCCLAHTHLATTDVRSDHIIH